jgi:hypothetical protein
MGRSGSRLVDYIQQRHERDGVKVVGLEPMEEHGFYGWLARSFVPGLKVPVKPVDLGGYRLVYLLAPKWSYNCPPINGFVDSHELKGLSLALIVTYTKGSVSGYVARMAKKIKARGANILGTLSMKREEILSDRFGEKMQALWDNTAFNKPPE